MQIRLNAEFAELPRLEAWARALAEAFALSPRTARNVDLCLAEAATNIASYAYPPGAAGTIEIEAEREDGRVVIRIADRGMPFDPGAFVLPELPHTLEEAPVGGQGLRLIRHFADEIGYRREGGCNRVTLVFRTDAA